MTPIHVLSVVLLLAGAHDHGSGDPAAPAGQAAEDPYADNACVQCHRSIAGRMAEIVDLEWANSVHYENSVACDGCHGGDASVRPEQFPSSDAYKQAAHLERNPEFLHLHGDETAFVSRARGRSVSYFCGRCHTEIMEKHLGSPHGNFGDPSCLFCHGQGSHAIKHATVDIIDTRPRAEAGRCSLCHKSATMKVVADVREVLEKTAAIIESSAEEFEKLEAMGYRNLALAEMHAHKKDTQSKLRRVFHSFNMRDINDLAHSIESVSEQTDYAYSIIKSLQKARKMQTIVGIATVVFLLAFAGLLMFYKRAFCEHYDRSSARPPAEPASK